jgi:hypothetical protein
MSPKLPVVFGQAAHRSSRKVRTSDGRPEDSHVRLLHETDPQRTPVTVPLHSEIAFGTLKRILRDAQLTPEQLISML